MAQAAVRDDRSSADRIVEAAEALIGRHGLDGVSLRQIRAAAGSSNNNAVQYHFGDLAGVVRAILTRRMAEVDRVQRALLDQLVAHGLQGDVRALLDVFLRPLLQPRDAEGDRVYARFTFALLNSTDGPRFHRELFDLAPAAGRLQDLLRQALPHLPPGVILERLRLTALMVLASAFNRVAAPADAAGDAALIDDALDVAAAGLAAPARLQR